MSEYAQILELLKEQKERGELNAKAIQNMSIRMKRINSVLLGDEYNEVGALKRLDITEIKASEAHAIVKKREKQFKWALGSLWTAIGTAVGMALKRYFGE